MKKLLLLLPFFVLLSCTLQKRKYQNGYYVDWHSNTSKKETGPATHKKTVVAAEKEIAPETVVVNEQAEPKEKVLPAFIAGTFKRLELKKSIRFLASPPEDTCDVLVFKDGSEIKGKVKEIGASEIKYKRCDTPDGPTYISKKSELFMIKYANGTREVIKSESEPQQTKTQAPSQNLNTYKQQRYNRQNHPLAIASLFFGILCLVVVYVALIAAMIGVLYTGAIFILPFLFALAAVVTGKTALNRIREQPDVYKGKGMALPGFIMGLCVLGIYALALFIFLLIFAGL